MKIAIVCDWLITVGGAEKVLEQMLECFPNADLFAVIDFLPKEKRTLIKSKKVTTTFLQKIPFIKHTYRSFLPLMPMAIEQLDVSNYDVIISSSHAVAKGIITGPNQLHICYCHSPIRYAWDLQHQYLIESRLSSGIRSILARYALHKMRIWDTFASNNIDYFIANSKFIAKRINKFYRREASVIYPPVNTQKVSNLNQALTDDYYITVSRMVPYKKIDLIVEAFTLMPERNLVVIGDGPGLKSIRKLAKNHDNIKILGYQNDQVVKNYMDKAKAFIFAAEEDFGIVPVEAQASGIPVIAFFKGGALETVNSINNGYDVTLRTGHFFKEQTVWSLMVAVNEFETMPPIPRELCIKNADKFKESRFKEEFTRFVIDRYKEFQTRK